MIAFHNTTSRYMYALGREGVLPRQWGRTSAATGSPHVASLTQSALGLLVIAVYALAGWDPLVTLFYRGGTSGGLGVLLLIAATSISVVVFFARHPSGETVWRRRVAPILAMVCLLVVVILALDNVDVLLGVPADHALVSAIPAAFAVAALLGAGWGLILRKMQPTVYARIGLGAKAALAGIADGAPTPAPHPASPIPRAAGDDPVAARRADALACNREPGRSDASRWGAANTRFPRTAAPHRPPTTPATTSPEVSRPYRGPRGMSLAALPPATNPSGDHP